MPNAAINTAQLSAADAAAPHKAMKLSKAPITAREAD